MTALVISLSGATIAAVSGPSPAGTALPVGYRPPENLAFSVAAGLGGPVVENVDVFTNGVVYAVGTTNAAVSLDGISFRVS